MVRAPAGHTGASRWRTSEPPHSSTKTLPTLTPCYPASNPNHSILNSLSLILSYCLSHLPPSPLTRFPSSFFLTQLIQIQIHLLFGRLLISHCAFSGRCLFFWGFFCFYIFTSLFLYCLSQISSLKMFQGSIYWHEKSKQQWLGLYLSQKTIRLEARKEKERTVNGHTICFSKCIRL